MGAYKNDYTKEDDLALWILHEIRHKTAPRAVRAETINRAAKELIRERRLTNLRLLGKLGSF